MRIVGIDPGLGTTGYGVLEVSPGHVSLLEGGTIRGGAGDLPLEMRLSSLYDGLMEVLAQFHPSALALEELYSHYDHPTTAILMGHARGVICLAAARSGVPVFSYAATAVKLAVAGDGRASKEAMQRAVKQRLGLGEAPRPHDVADALAIALCHSWAMGSPLAAAMRERSPRARREALE